MDNKIQSFLLEFAKLLNNQNLVLTAQKSILIKLGTLEQQDPPSNSGLNSEDCIPCPEIEPIQQSYPELNIIITQLQSLTEKINMLENPYKSVKLTTKEINDDLTKIRSDLTYFSEISILH